MSPKSERDNLRRKTEKAENVTACNSYRDAAPLLRRPFTPEAVRFKVVEAWADTPDGRPTKDQGLSYATIAPYITAREVIARLNLVCPELWSMGKPEAMGGQWWVPLRMRHSRESEFAELEQWDLSDTYQGKARLSDAIKRTAVHFGVGESLYAVPAIELTRPELAPDEGGGPSSVYLRPWRDNGETWLKLTRAGEEHARDIYRRWLLARGGGITSFGKPIDHGNLTMRGECEGEGPPMPVMRPGEKRDTPGRGHGRQAPPKVQTTATPITVAPVDPEAEADAKLAALLAQTDGLNTLRDVLNKTMIAQGYTSAPERLKTIVNAGDKRGLTAALNNLSRHEKATGEQEGDAQ